MCSEVQHYAVGAGGVLSIWDLTHVTRSLLTGLARFFTKDCAVRTGPVILCQQDRSSSRQVSTTTVGSATRVYLRGVARSPTPSTGGRGFLHLGPAHPSFSSGVARFTQILAVRTGVRFAPLSAKNRQLQREGQLLSNVPQCTTRFIHAVTVHHRTPSLRCLGNRHMQGWRGF